MGRCLSRQGFEVHLYGMKFWDGPNVIERDGLYLHGLMKARPIYNDAGRRTISQAVLFGLACIKLLVEDFDVMDCCAFPYFSLFSCRIITFVRRKPLFATWHEVWGRKYWREYLGRLGAVGAGVEWLAARLPDAIIASSQHTADRLRSELHVEGPIDVVPNGIDIDTVASTAPARIGSDLIYAGRLMDFKNIHLVIEALARLESAGVHLTCGIVGEGPHKPRLQALAMELGVDRQIRWLGFLEDGRDVYAHMKASRLFVLPSRREGFGIVVIEANACGIPVLTADLPGNAATDLIRDGVNGRLFEPTVDGLSSAIERALAEAGALERSSREVAGEFDWAVLASRAGDVYSS
jgi:glycosyltransferase involved in cell wall biosynthesis